MYYRHILNARDSMRWHHCNPELQRGFQQMIDDDVSLAAVDAGYDCWLIFDRDETLLGQGVLTEPDGL